jgi:predicted transcriptional regulator
MLVEIPDYDVILGMATAFIVGILALFIYYKAKPYINIKEKQSGNAYDERLERYERELIDMKIRLDLADIGSVAPAQTNNEEGGKETKSPEITAQITSKEEEITQPVRKMGERMPNLGYNDAINHVLRLITDKNMTSRDIQIAIGRTREHTSRLMKKLFEDGYVQRNTNVKPYTYSITEKGKDKLKRN